LGLRVFASQKPQSIVIAAGLPFIITGVLRAIRLDKRNKNTYY
jgi:hypothetical protein